MRRLRVSCSAALTLVVLTCVVQTLAQVAGPNINMVSGTQYPGGDPYLQRQNEPSMAVSTRNPQHLFAGANDYRSVDIPIPPDSGVETGDAWMGVFSSLDGGQTWKSTLLPGYPQDQTPTGLASPLHAFSVATDPTVRAGTHGLFYYSGLVFSRGTNAASGVFVSTFQDQNNKGNGSPITYLNSTLIDSGTSGQFIDKPWIAVDVPRPGTSIGAATCSIGGKTLTSGKVYIFYTIFLGHDALNPHSQIREVSSSNCGRTWSKPFQLSQTLILNQGTVAAIDPGNGTVYVAWRQLASNGQLDSIQVGTSTNGGASFTVATAYTFPASAQFDQAGSGGSFRENDLPALTVDGSGRVWLAFSQRNKGPYGTSRIMMTTKTRTGTTWSTPFVTDTNASGPGHQFMPALSFAYGKVFLSFYDNRDDNTSGQLQCPTPPCSKFTDLVETRVAVAGSDRALGNLTTLFGAAITDAGAKIRHTIDVRGALVDPTKFNAAQNPPLAFPSFRISQYKYGSRPGSHTIEQMQFNPPNFPMFVHGTRSFIGDYIDVAALTMVPGPNGTWTFNTQTSNAAVFHTTWTDNRDVRPPPVVCTNGVCTQNWSLYTPVASTGGSSAYDSTQNKPLCAVGQTGSRNQNVYTARITQGLLVGLKENSKSLLNSSNAPIQRAFSVFATNTTGLTSFYRLTINPPPAGTTASFDQKTSVPSLDVTVLAKTTISRSIFVTSSSANPTLSITVAEIVGIGGALKPNGLQSTVLINPDPTNPKSTNPDIITFDATNPDITTPYSTNPDITNAEVYDPTVTNPDITNPDITNPDITNPDITNPDITNPDITNPDITSMVVTNPDITNPDITNPDITNPDITNPDITNPDITNLSDSGGITDFTYKVTNKGNTSSSYNAKQFAKQLGLQCCPTGCPGGNGCPASCSKCQLIARKTYPTPIANACSLTVEVQNIPISNIPNPVFTTQGNAGNPDNSSDPSNATVSLSPGEGGRVTLRVFGPLVVGNNPGTPVKTIAVAGGANTGQNFAAASLAIITVALPVGVVGTPYSTTLQSVGGVGSKTWAETGSLPTQLILNQFTGTISGPVTAPPSPYVFTAQVNDSATGLPNNQTNTDMQTLELDVNKFSISSVTVANTNTQSIYLKAGDSATVRVTVSNQGPANASFVNTGPLVINPVAAGTPSGPTPSVSCAPAAPVNAFLSSNTSQEFDYTCSNVSGNGYVTFSATASGKYINTAASVSALAGAVTSNQVTVDTTPPTLSFAAASPGPNGAGWNNSNVSHSYTTADNLSGVASSLPASPLIISTEGKNLTASTTITDAAGNAAVFTTSPGVNIDKTPPVISRTVAPGANGNGWNNTPVTVTFSCLDNPVLIASGVGSLTPPATTLSSEGANQSANGTCTDVAGNSSNTSATGINIDFTAPSAAIITPPTGATYVVNQPVPANYTCGDALSGIFACSGTVPFGSNIATGAVGPFVFSLTPTDKATNVALASTNYSVRYNFTGFLSPLGTAGTLAEPSDSGGFAVGSKVPVRWQLSDFGGNSISQILANSSLQALLTPNCVGAAPDGAASIALIKDGVALRTEDAFAYEDSSSRFAFTWDTSTLASGGCYNLVLTLADGHSYSTIVHLTFNGFKAPLKAAGSAAAPSDSAGFAVGSTIPVRWQFEDGSGSIVTTDQTTSISSIKSFLNPTCTGAASADATAISLFADGTPVGPNTMAFQTDGTYEFGWDTSMLVSGGCYNLVVATSDGNAYSTIVHLSFNGFKPPLKVAGTTSKPSDSGSFALSGGLRIPWQFEDGSGTVVVTDQTATISSIQAFLNVVCAGAASTDTVPISLFANGTTTGSNVLSFQPDGTYQLTWDTSSLPGEGCYNIVVTTSDGNAYVTIVHLVIPAFDGFLPPLAVAGPPSDPTDSGNIAMASPIPIEWRFNDGGGTLITSNLQGILQSIQVIANPACAGAPPDGAASTTLFSGGTPAAGDTYSFDKPSSTYVYTWHAAVDPGCYNLVLGLTDGSLHATIINLN